MSEKVQQYTPFGTLVRSFVPSHDSRLYKKEIAQFGLDYDKETGSSVIVLRDPLDLYAEIQSHRDECGLEFAQLQIKRGLADPSDFAAVPGDYGDTSTLPDNINDAYQAAQAAKHAAGSVDLRQFKSDADIQAYVNKIVAEQLAAKEAAAKAQATVSTGDKQ